MTNHDVTLYMDVFFPLLSRVLRATLFKYPLSFRFSYICISLFIYLFFNIVYRVYIFFGMYIWNFISLKGKWKFWLLLLFSTFNGFVLLCQITIFAAWNFFFFILYREWLCIINFTVHSMFGKFEKLS